MYVREDGTSSYVRQCQHLQKRRSEAASDSYLCREWIRSLCSDIIAINRPHAWWTGLSTISSHLRREMGERYSDPTPSDAGFESLSAVNQALSSSSNTSIPNLAHFVYTSGRKVAWPEWSAIRGAFVNLGVDKAILWLPVGAQTKGAM